MQDANIDFLVSVLLGLVVTSCFLRLAVKYGLSKRICNENDIELSGNSTRWISEIKKLRNGGQWKAFVDRMRKNHSKVEYDVQFTLAMLMVKTMEQKEMARFCKLLYSIELEIHKEKNEVHRCLKEKIDGKLCKTLLDGVYPGMMDKMTPDAIKSLVTRKKDQITSTRLGKVFKICLAMVIFYTDLVKDFFLWKTLVTLVGVSALFSAEFFSYFEVQVIWIIGACLFLPLMISAIQIAMYSPLSIFGYSIDNDKVKGQIPKYWVACIQVFTILLFPLIPAMIILTIQAKEEKLMKYVKKLQNNIEQQQEIGIIVKKVIEAKKFLRRTKRLLLTIKVAEVLENSGLIVIQTLMLALHQTQTSTTSGLETAFGSQNQISTTIFLVLSIVWSFRTSVTTRIKAKTASLDFFLPSLGAVVIGLRSFLMIGVKTACIVVFFAPYMGLFNILRHWQAEQIPLKKELVAYPELFRSNHSTNPPTPPGQDYYIGNLREGYLIFLGLWMLHFVLIYFCKIAMSKKFSQSSSCSKMQQVLNNFSLPDADFDWSKETGDLSEHSTRRKRHLLEVFLLSALQWAINMIMIVPFWILGIY